MRGLPNRVFWTVLAVVLVVAGAGGLALSEGAFGSRRQHRVILTGSLIHDWHKGGNASFEIAGGVAAFAFLVGVVVALLQLRYPGAKRVRLGDLRYGDRRTKGRTLVRGGALRRAVEVDLGRIEGVTRAVASVYDLGGSGGNRAPGRSGGGSPAPGRSGGNPAQTELDATLDIDGDVDLPAVARAVEGSIGRWNATTGRPIAETAVLVRLVTRSPDDRHLK